MKKTSTLFLKAVVLLVAIATIAAMLWLPQVEGRNVGKDFTYIYLQDPFLAFAYAASIPFFVGLYQAFLLLGHIEKNQVFSESSIRALRKIKYCAIAQIILILIGQAIILIGVRDEDFAGPVMLGIFATFATIVIATAAAIFERLLQNAVDIKSENDLTV